LRKPERLSRDETSPSLQKPSLCDWIRLIDFTRDGLGFPFQNLGFEDGQFPFFLPGWNAVQPVARNVTQPFQDSSSVLDTSYRNTTQPASPVRVPVVGTYSLGIWPYSGGRFDEFPFILRQTGDIPADAQSLRFLYHGDSLTVYLSGSPTPVHFLEDRPSGDPGVPLFHYYAVDVSGYAGQTTELRFDFRSFGNYPGQDGGQIPGWPDARMHVLNDLSFSPLPAVPEPATWALLGIGCLALLWSASRR
jgi:hypothetical protein